VIITLLRKVYDVLEALRQQIMAAQDAVAHLQEDVLFVQRKLGIIPYTIWNWRMSRLLAPRLLAESLWKRHLEERSLDAAKYGMVGITAKGTDKVKIVRPPEMYFGVDWARDEKNG
jgi:hypothetical protein